MVQHSSTESRDPFFRAKSEAHDAIHAARDSQESARTTRRRVRLHGLIASWRNRRTDDLAVRSERLALVLDAVRDDADAPMGTIQIFENGVLRIRTAAGLDERFLSHFAVVPPGKCACGKAHATGAAVVVDDVRASDVFEDPDREELLKAGIAAVQSLPLARAGRPRRDFIALPLRTNLAPPPSGIHLAR
jgi:hypothetical protein